MHASVCLIPRLFPNSSNKMGLGMRLVHVLMCGDPAACPHMVYLGLGMRLLHVLMCGDPAACPHMMYL